MNLTRAQEAEFVIHELADKITLIDLIEHLRTMGYNEREIKAGIQLWATSSVKQSQWGSL